MSDSVRYVKDSKKRDERRCCRDDNLKIPQDGGGRFKGTRERIRRIERERHIPRWRRKICSLLKEVGWRWRE